MEQKLQSATSQEVSRASNAHYQAESEIMDHIRSMTLAGKKQLAMKMSQHVVDAEKESKSK